MSHIPWFLMPLAVWCVAFAALQARRVWREHKRRQRALEALKR